MKISRNWLQTFFDAPLPEAAVIGDALTFHAFEIESIEGDILDVKVTANRGHDCLSHRGIAKELSAIVQMPIKNDPLRQPVSLEPKTDKFIVSIEKPELCARFTGAYITGLTVGPSPEWLRTALEAIGQRSINNVVDATNYVMFNVGQPLHAFDAGKLTQKDGTYALVVRTARQDETMLGLDDKEYTLTASMLAITDGHTGEVVSIAGIKGGKPTGVDESTTAILLEAANWDGVTIRKTSQALKLRTDASDRFQQVISAELGAYGLKAATDLILQIAGGKVVGFVDEYPRSPNKRQVSVTLSKINAVLGTELGASDIVDVFQRLGFSHMEAGEEFTVTVPFERLDLVIAEDLIEEVARIVGYDKVPAVELSTFPHEPKVNENFYAVEKAREEFIAKGYSEVYTSVFAEKGERMVANKVDGARPYLRTSLLEGLTLPVVQNLYIKELLGLKKVKLFEIGSVWKGGQEDTHIYSIEAESQPLKGNEFHSQGTQTIEISLGDYKKQEAINNPQKYEDYPISELQKYQPFSHYPFIVRDIAMWVPSETKPEDVLAVLRSAAGELLTRSEKFDEFKKGDRTSLAFRLVLQSPEKTLTDEEANAVMEKVYASVKEKGWEVR